MEIRPTVDLVIVDGPDTPRTVTVDSWPFEVGRSCQHGLVLSDQTVSRRHFRIYWIENRLAIEDLASTSGLMINGEKVQRAWIRPGDQIQAGSTILRVMVRLARVDTPATAPREATAPRNEAVAARVQQQPTMEVEIPVHRPHFRLSAATYESLAAAAAGDFVARLVLAMRKVFPEPTTSLSDERLTALGREGLRRSEKYDLTTEWNIWVFCACMLVFGRSFDEDPKNPWAREVLGERGFVEDTKAKLLGLRLYMATGKAV